jgi:hypothetical protein
MYVGALPGRIPDGSERASLDALHRTLLQEVTMSASSAVIRPSARIAGVCGVVSVALLLAAPAVPSPGVASTVWLLGWLVLLPFFAGLAVLVREAGGRVAWLAPAIPAAAAVLVAVHLASAGVEYAANSLSLSSPAHEPLHAAGGAMFTLAMLPFGVALLAVAAAGFWGQAVPRWLACVALVVGSVALVNGCMLGTEAAWGFLLSLVWMAAGGITLALRRAVVAVPHEPAAAAVAGR